VSGRVRIVLPHHLRTLARVGDEVQIAVAEPVTIGAVLDALEREYPVLRGTIREHGTLKRRPLVRFFACEQDFSHESPDTEVPAAVAAGTEPFFVVGAMAGG
jgi:sulfur-carrier protein